MMIQISIIKLHKNLSDVKAHLSSYKGGSDIEAGALGVRNPLLVDLHQLPDALQQLTFIKQLLKDNKDINGHLLHCAASFTLFSTDWEKKNTWKRTCTQLHVFSAKY